MKKTGKTNRRIYYINETGDFYAMDVDITEDPEASILGTISPSGIDESQLKRIRNRRNKIFRELEKLIDQSIKGTSTSDIRQRILDELNNQNLSISDTDAKRRDEKTAVGEDAK
ncbi:MAG: hypothetical protein IJU44_00505 [Kiritimatiellae bacterium]|nr:hypothetical protein [Kiritimatiellia bacterium]